MARSISLGISNLENKPTENLTEKEISLLGEFLFSTKTVTVIYSYLALEAYCNHDGK
jgi:hypothetical protein